MKDDTQALAQKLERKLKLTKQQRDDFFAGRYPRLSGEGSCPVGRGYKHRLSSRLSFEVTLVRRTRVGGWSLEYTVFNQRLDADNYLRPVASPVAIDEKGNPKPMGEAEAHGYTSNPKSRLAEHAPVVPADYQKVLVTRAKERFEQHRREAQDEDQVRRDFKAVTQAIKQTAVDLARAGVDPMPFMTDIQRVVNSYAEDDKAA